MRDIINSNLQKEKTSGAMCGGHYKLKFTKRRFQVVFVKSNLARVKKSEVASI